MIGISTEGVSREGISSRESTGARIFGQGRLTSYGSGGLTTVNETSTFGQGMALSGVGISSLVVIFTLCCRK